MRKAYTFTLVVLVAATVLGTRLAKAEGTTPIQLSLFPGLCLFDEDTAVRGMRVNFLLGVNESLSGIDLGCGVNWVPGPMTGLQIGGLGNKSDVLHGAQLGLIANSADTMRGLQIGIVNVAEDAQGIQIGMTAQVKGDLTGIQISATPLIYAGGASSVEGTMKGWQSGLVCTAREMIGLQDGLIANGAGRLSRSAAWTAECRWEYDRDPAGPSELQSGNEGHPDWGSQYHHRKPSQIPSACECALLIFSAGRRAIHYANKTPAHVPLEAARCALSSVR